MAMYRTEDFKTPEGRLSFATGLFKARAQGTDPGSKQKFGATLIFPNAMKTAKVCRTVTGKLLSLQDLVADAIVGEWGEKGLQKAKNGLIKSPFLAGDGKEARNKTTGELHGGLGPDVFFIRVSANLDRQPLVSASATAVVPATEADVYSGCYGFAVLNAYTWTHPSNGDGVSFGISKFYKKADGDRLGGEGGNSNPEQWLETVEDHGAAPAEARGGAGAGGLFGD